MKVVAIATLLGSTAVLAQSHVDAQAPSPIAAHASLWTEDLTAFEVRDAIKARTTTIIIGTGGVDYNGPYRVSGKHHYVLQTVLPYIAREIGHAPIAPLVKFLPEGSIDPPNGATTTGWLPAAVDQAITSARDSTSDWSASGCR